MNRAWSKGCDESTQCKGWKGVGGSVLESLVSWVGAGVMASQHNGQWSSWVPGLGRAYRSPPYVYVCTHTHTHTCMRHRRTQFIIKYLAYFAARLRASAYYNNISGQLPAWLQLETRIHEPYDNNNNAMVRRGSGRGRGRGKG